MWRLGSLQPLPQAVSRLQSLLTFRLNLEQLAYVACILARHDLEKARDQTARQSVAVMRLEAVKEIGAHLHWDELLLV